MLTKKHDTTKPQGVRGRNSDNRRLAMTLGWEPPTPLKEGLEPTYRWIASVAGRRGETELASTRSG